MREVVFDGPAPDAGWIDAEPERVDVRPSVKGRILRDLTEPEPVEAKPVVRARGPAHGSSGAITIEQTRQFLRDEDAFIPTEPIRWRKTLSGEIQSRSIAKPRTKSKPKSDGEPSFKRSGAMATLRNGESVPYYWRRWKRA